MPENVLVVGRLIRINESQLGLTWTLLRDGKVVDFHFSQIPPNAQFVIEGDVVAVLSSVEFILLAPHLKRLPQRNFNKEVLSDWTFFIRELRTFFVKHDFLELRTPTLVTCPGTEPTLDVFSTRFKYGSKQTNFFLPTSPELHLKKALALGAEKIFEITNCYRNGEVTERHQPEFLMIEWYRAFDNLKNIKRDVIDLVTHLAKSLNLAQPRNIKSFSVQDLFKMHCDFELTPQTSMQELKLLADKLHLDTRSAESIDDYFFLIFLERIESQLPPDDLVFVEKYPPYQAALARLTEDGWGDRFEVYWRGLELANAFHELNDPIIQRLRANNDLKKKKELGKDLVDLDEEFFQCLEAGMPPSGGIALGVERLYMAFKNISQLSDVRIFPLKP
jgi:lysyl-tRNA synthetase class 2